MGTMNTPLPSLFVSHGSPTIALEPREAGRFMQALGAEIVARWGRPRAVIVASAHSLTNDSSDAPVLLAAPRHEAVHDFRGFDPRLSRLRYDAPGAPELASRVQALCQAGGVEVDVIDEGGLDHGIWTAMRYLFPQADVPLLPLAWPGDWMPARLFKLGQALAPLTADGVLVVGSGSITHNLRRVFASGRMPAVDQPVTPESQAFREWFATASAAADWPALFDYRRQAPHAQLMHPTDEHLLPWFVAAGAGGGGTPGRRIHASFTHGDLGMDAYAFGPAAATFAAA